MSSIRSGLVAVIAGGAVRFLSAQRPLTSFVVEEATISQIHTAMKAGRLTCGALVTCT